VIIAVEATNLQASNVTNHSAVFTWEIAGSNIGCNGKEINTAFRIRYRPVLTAQQEGLNSRKKRVVLNNLLPFTNYSVAVTTIDPSGPNVKSLPFFFTSLSGGMYCVHIINSHIINSDLFFCYVVPSAPINVTTVTNSNIPTQLLITWQVGHLINIYL